MKTAFDIMAGFCLLSGGAALIIARILGAVSKTPKPEKLDDSQKVFRA